MSIEIRAAEPEDRSSIVECRLASQRVFGMPDPDFWPPETLAEGLDSRLAVERYVATVDRQIAGHGLIQETFEEDRQIWRKALSSDEKISDILELGAAFTHPNYAQQGVYIALFNHRLERVRKLGKIPVAMTWTVNEHLISFFESNGGLLIGGRETRGPYRLSHYVF